MADIRKIHDYLFSPYSHFTNIFPYPPYRGIWNTPTLLSDSPSSQRHNNHYSIYYYAFIALLILFPSPCGIPCAINPFRLLTSQDWDLIIPISNFIIAIITPLISQLMATNKATNDLHTPSTAIITLLIRLLKKDLKGQAVQ